jgi:hypothetical protein
VAVIVAMFTSHELLAGAQSVSRPPAADVRYLVLYR